MLMKWATQGVPTQITPSFPLEVLEFAVQQGAHPSAKKSAAALELRKETLEKVAQGRAQLVKWEELRHNLPPDIRISPIAAIPHKSRAY
jgi:hypothetical protein